MSTTRDCISSKRFSFAPLRPPVRARDGQDTVRGLSRSEASLIGTNGSSVNCCRDLIGTRSRRILIVSSVYAKRAPPIGGADSPERVFSPKQITFLDDFSSFRMRFSGFHFPFPGTNYQTVWFCGLSNKRPTTPYQSKCNRVFGGILKNLPVQRKIENVPGFFKIPPKSRL